ncbi:hypothetical protein N2600_03975 [Rhizobium sp. WSM1274]|uniref:hypothetical protein n=1 Tax=Rhizobium sp. WSM1274 TaxID=3138254 RepID=UPI0021A79948|nr:hypothetical protein [Rhizobium leguminosarum]UWU29139.1 hypothetical protein N2600_03975 [Rhizobium leguminosarum bv. viciae]
MNAESPRFVAGLILSLENSGVGALSQVRFVFGDTALLAYHYTSSMHLPWILASGELRPSGNNIRNFPSPDFVWATTTVDGDRTASASTSHRAYRAGMMLQVRVTFDASHFFAWQEVGVKFPQWTGAHIGTLEASARAMRSNPATWLCRDQPLSLQHAMAFDIRSYASSKWRALRSTDVRIIRENGLWLAMDFGGKVFASHQSPASQGAFGYTPAEIKVPFETLPLLVRG